MENGKFVRKSTHDNFITEKVDIFKNNLLGEYDSDGKYEIAPQIIDELVALKKVRKSSYDNSMFCSGNLLGFGEIDFEISYEKSRDHDNNAKAYLYVLEDVDKINGYLQNTLKTKIAEFSSNDSDFIEESYLKFNVTDESQDDDESREKKTLDDLELEDSYILAKKAYMLLLGKLSEEKVLDAYGKYFTTRLTILTKLDNEFSNAVLQNFNQKYELIENVFLREKNYKALNELLDSCIESVSGTKEIFINQEKDFLDIMKEHLDAFTENVSRLNDKAEQKAIDMLDPDDRKKLNQMNTSLESDDEIKNTEERSHDEEVPQSSIESEISESFQNPVLIESEELQEINEENQTLAEEEPTPVEEQKSGIVEHILQIQTENKFDDDISKEFVDSNVDFQKTRQSDRLSKISDTLSRLSSLSGSEEQSELQDPIEDSIDSEDKKDTFDSPAFDNVETSESGDMASEQYDDVENKDYNVEDEVIEETNISEERVEQVEENKLTKDRFSVLFDYLEKKQDSEKDNNFIGKNDGENVDDIHHNSNDYSM